MGHVAEKVYAVSDRKVSEQSIPRWVKAVRAAKDKLASGHNLMADGLTFQA